MNGNRIDLPKDIYTFRGVIVFASTDKWFTTLRGIGVDPYETLRKLSEQKQLYIANRKNRDGRSNYYLKLPFGCVSVALKESDLLLRHVETFDVDKNNLFVKAGVQIYSDGISITVRNRADNKFLNYVNGRQTLSNPLSSSTDIVKLKQWLDIDNEKEPIAQAAQQEELSETLIESLECARQYAIIEDEIEKAEANSENVIMYHDINPADDYDRIDKVAYTFTVGEYNQDAYKEGVTLRLEDKNANQLTASLLKAEESVDERTQKPIYTITLLFNDQINVDQIDQMGSIRLDHSSVQLNVQEDAIDSILERTAKSTYMNNVLGKHRPLPLQKKDLGKLKRELSQKEFPPNKSQIEAIEMGINASDIALVLGPPGTGKTTVILEWVRYFVLVEKKRVLISSQNNKAVDNVLERLTQEGGIETIRAGKEDKIQANIRPFMFENKLMELQKKVNATTRQKLLLLDKILDNSKNTYELCDKLIKELEKLNEIDSKTQQYIQSKYNSKIQLLQADCSKFTQLHDEYQQLTAHISSIISWMTRYKNSGKINRFIKKLKHNKMSAQLPVVYKQQVLLYEQCVSMKSKVNEQLTVLTAELQSDRTIDQAILKMTECLRQFDKQVPTIDFEDITPNIIIDSKNILDKKYLTNAMQEIIEATERIKNIRQAVYDWQQHISNQKNFILSDILLGTANLVGATCVGINSNKRFSRIDFDVTIIDEAGQIQIHNALVPMSRSEKLIMLGDHKQIPPSVDDAVVERCSESDCDMNLLYKSLFEYLYSELPAANKKFLDTQYRMPNQIADTISSGFYEDKYKSHSSKNNMASLFPNLFKNPFAIVSTSDSAIRFEEKIEGGGSRNRFEAEIVVKIVEQIFELQSANDDFNYEDVCSSKIGIISAYKSQVALIRSMLVKHISGITPFIANEMVATLDSYQGQERDTIIYSCTRSNKQSNTSRRIGFLNELRRLNVAMTRCKKQFVFIGDMDFLSSCQYEKNSDIFGVPPISEKEFSKFISLVCDRVKSGSGDFVTSKDMLERLK